MFRHNYLFPILLSAVIIIAGNGCEITEVSPDDNIQNGDTTQNQDNRLLYVISDSNYWGGKIIKEVDSVMSLLKITDYTLSNYIVDVEGGRLVLDCSKYLETILKEVSPFHYNELPKSSKSGRTSLAKDYYNHFITLPSEPDGSHCWIRINNPEDARPGDIISYIHDEGGSTTGHVMIICSYPLPSGYSPIDYSFVVNDAANSGHYEDTRNKEGNYSEDYIYSATLHFDGGVMKFSGVGIGTMWFHIGSNSYYRWRSESGSKVHKSMAIGRMTDIP